MFTLLSRFSYSGSLPLYSFLPVHSQYGGLGEKIQLPIDSSQTFVCFPCPYLHNSKPAVEMFEDKPLPPQPCVHLQSTPPLLPPKQPALVRPTRRVIPQHRGHFLNTSMTMAPSFSGDFIKPNKPAADTFIARRAERKAAAVGR